MRLSTFLAIVLVAPIPAGAQTLTPWGDPDLQGVWTTQTPVPLERPRALAGKTFFTSEESAEFEKTALERLLALVAAEVPLSGELNGVWLETRQGKVPPSRRTSLTSTRRTERFSIRRKADSGGTLCQVWRGHWGHSLPLTVRRIAPRPSDA